jgi:hypothetical protein
METDHLSNLRRSSITMLFDEYICNHQGRNITFCFGIHFSFIPIFIWKRFPALPLSFQKEGKWIIIRNYIYIYTHTWKGAQPQQSNPPINYMTFNLYCIKRLKCTSAIETGPTLRVELYGRRSHTHLIVERIFRFEVLTAVAIRVLFPGI